MPQWMNQRLNTVATTLFATSSSIPVIFSPHTAPSATTSRAFGTYSSQGISRISSNAIIVAADTGSTRVTKEVAPAVTSVISFITLHSIASFAGS